MVLIGINVTIWLAVMVSGRSSSRLLDFFMLSPQGHCASLADPSKYYPNATTSEACQHIALLGDGQWANGFADGWWWQALTSAFTHSALTHVAFNMLALWFLGPALESVIGRARFLAVYLLAALAGSVAVLWLGEASASTLGASGAIWGLLAAHIVGARRFKGDTRSLMTWLALNVAFTVVIPGISWQAHLGGFVGGALAAAIIFYAPRERRTQIQVLGLGALTLVIVVLMALRAAALS
jgi:membrane associated rhomboid family serine protease